ncbi:MAG: hypothetical protein HN380_26035 [Victivallales bacterium]|nr:hypothetical protein [Victivallales bacterium]
MFTRPMIALALTLTVGVSFPDEVVLKNPGFETGKLDGWDRPVPETTFQVSEETAHSGGFSLRCQGDSKHQYNPFAHFVQTVDIEPIPGTRYQITGWVRGVIRRGKKSARLSVRQVNAKDTTISYAEIWLQPGADEWREVTRVFRAAEGAVKFQVYVILSNLTAEDVVFLDDIRFDAIDALGKPVSVVPPAFSGRAGKMPGRRIAALELHTEGVTARIDTTTGLLASLTLTDPSPIQLHPGGPDGAAIFLAIGDREVLFNRPLGEMVRGGHTLSATLAPSDPAIPLVAEVTYSADGGVFEETVRLRATGEIKALCRLGVRHGFVPGRWERIIGGLRPVRVIDADEGTLFTYGERERDLSPDRLDAWQSVTFPMNVLEGADRWVVVGDRSLDAFVTLTPNTPAGFFPSVQQNPIRIKSGDTFRFSLTWKSFPKRTNLLRDAWRWYGENVHTENPLLTGFVPYRAHFPARTLPPGCEVSASGKPTGRGARFNTNNTLPGSNVWYYGWQDAINERYPTEGEWWTNVAGWHKQSAVDFRAAIAEYRENGFKCYLYFRQLANLAQRGKPLPEDWFRAGPGGSLDMYGGGYTVALPPKVQKDTGYPQIPWGMYNFGSASFRADYLAQCRACMDYYTPAGIGWDMGWAPKNPGIFAVQGEMYRWLAEHHPEMRVISNEASGTPSQWYSDCVLIENGILYGKSKWDYEVGKAFGTQIASIERAHQFRRLAANIVQGKAGWAYPAGRLDAERCADWALALPDMPAEEEARIRRLSFRMHMRAGLRNMGLGANWAYADDMRLYPWPLPKGLLAFMREIMNVPPMHESFSLRLAGGSDTAGQVHAGGWADATRLRLAVFNDSAAATDISLLVSRGALTRHGWRGSCANASVRLADTAGAFIASPCQIADGTNGITIRGSIPPFALLVVSEGSK